jgi:hypothetical protein
MQTPLFNAALATQLDSATTKTGWSNLFASLLGAGARIRCFRSSNAASEDPQADGMEFLNVATDGNYKISTGNIIGLGALSNVTVHIAATLSTGVSVLVIEKGIYKATFTLGLAGSGKDFMFAKNPTGDIKEGFSFLPGSGIKAPMFLPTGIGPAAPEPTPETVVAFRLLDGRDPSVRVVVGTASLTKREPDVVADRLFIAREMGDVRKTRTPDGGGIVFGTGGECFKFAGTSLLLNSSVNSEANVPLQQISIRAMPHNRWASWPFKKDFNEAEDTLIPWPFKIELLRADGTVKDVIEMYAHRDANNTPGSGKFINYAGQTMNPWAGPSEPFWACTQLLGWMSHIPKANTKVSHLLPGVEPAVFDPKHTKEGFSNQHVFPPVTTGTQTWNGLNVWRASPKYPRMMGTGFDTTAPEAELAFIFKGDSTSQVFAYGWQPGADAQHTMYMAPGGQRPDRSYKGNTVFAWATYPEGKRVHGNVPYKTMMVEFMKGYWGHGVHMYTNVERGTSIPKNRLLNHEVCYADVYYRGGDENYVPDIQNSAVRLFSATKGNNLGVMDKNGRSMNNEYARDYQHNQSNSSLGAYLMNSPMHMLEATNFFAGNVLCTSWIMGVDFNRDDFMTRQFVWYWGQFLDTWLSANNDENCINSTELENMWQEHIERVHDVIMPLYKTGTDIYSRTLRGMGIGSYYMSGGEGRTALRTWSDSKSGYMGQVLALMKQSGAWDMLRAKSEKCRAVLDLIIECCHKMTVDFFMDCNGRFDQYAVDMSWPNGFEPQGDINWAQYSPPFNGIDWIRREGGAIKTTGSEGSVDRTSTAHARTQMMFILDTFFPEYVYPRMAEAKTVVRKFYSDVKAHQDAGGDTWCYYYTMFGIYKAPAVVGAVN